MTIYKEKLIDKINQSEKTDVIHIMIFNAEHAIHHWNDDTYSIRNFSDSHKCVEEFHGTREELIEYINKNKKFDIALMFEYLDYRE